MKVPTIPDVSFADSFDRERVLSRTKEALWLELFDKHLGLCQASRVLDIGCGTGRFSIIIEIQHGCLVAGIDPSLEMLRRAKTKCPERVNWLAARGENLPFSACTFDVCLASQVLQHFDNKHQALAEVSRVLRPGGRLGIRCSSHTQLKTILDYRFFPSALAIEYDRLPDVPTLKDMLLAVGLGNFREYAVRQLLFESVDEYLEKLRNRYASFLFLLTEDEYQQGLRNAAEYFRMAQRRADDRYAEITFLVASKQIHRGH